MQRITDATAAATLPATPSLSGATGYFTEGSPGTIPATVVRAWFLNQVQEELMSILAAAGITPDTTGQVFNQVITAIQSLQRTKLASNFTIYVNAGSGNDTTGTGTSGAPFATLQHAIDYAYTKIDLNGHTLTIQLANGTYAGATVLGPMTGMNRLGNGIIILGNTSSPSSVIIDAINSIGVVVQNGAVVTISGLTIEATGTGPSGNGGGYGVLCQFAGLLIIGSNVVFASCSYSHIASIVGGLVSVTAPYSITAGANIHFEAHSNGSIYCIGQSVTLSGTPAFAQAFAFAHENGTLQVYGNTFSGSATGERYSAINNGVINTNGGGSTYLPGNSAGATSAGGVYA